MGQAKIEQLSHLTDDARRVLFAAMGGYDELYAQEIEAGRVELDKVGDGYVITRIESVPGHDPELVLCAIAGVNYFTVAPLLLNAARRAGCGTVRAHTNDDRLGAMYRRWGGERIECVYQLRLSDGQ